MKTHGGKVKSRSGRRCRCTTRNGSIYRTKNTTWLSTLYFRACNSLSVSNFCFAVTIHSFCFCQHLERLCCRPSSVVPELKLDVPESAHDPDQEYRSWRAGIERVIARCNRCARFGRGEGSPAYYADELQHMPAHEMENLADLLNDIGSTLFACGQSDKVDKYSWASGFVREGGLRQLFVQAGGLNTRWRQNLTSSVLDLASEVLKVTPPTDNKTAHLTTCEMAASSSDVARGIASFLLQDRQQVMSLLHFLVLNSERVGGSTSILAALEATRLLQHPQATTNFLGYGFEYIIETLNEARDNPSLRLDCMHLLSALVETSSNVVHRVWLRRALSALGFDTVLATIRKENKYSVGRNLVQACELYERSQKDDQRSLDRLEQMHGKLSTERGLYDAIQQSMGRQGQAEHGMFFALCKWLLIETYSGKYAQEATCNAWRCIVTTIEAYIDAKRRQIQRALAESTISRTPVEAALLSFLHAQADLQQRLTVATCSTSKEGSTELPKPVSHYSPTPSTYYHAFLLWATSHQPLSDTQEDTVAFAANESQVLARISELDFDEVRVEPEPAMEVSDGQMEAVRDEIAVRNHALQATYAQ